MLAAAARSLARRRRWPACHHASTPPFHTATSITTALQLAPTGRLHAIDLTSSEDCRCVNLMCVHVGGPCACRVAVALEKVAGRGGAATVSVLSLAANGLVSVPASVRELTALTELDVSGNQLVSVGKSNVFERLRALRHINVSGMPMLEDVGGLAHAASLEEVIVSDGVAAAAVERVGGGRWRVVVV